MSPSASQSRRRIGAATERRAQETDRETEGGFKEALRAAQLEDERLFSRRPEFPTDAPLQRNRFI